MRRVAALLAAVLLLTGTSSCGGDGAEPGAPRGVALVLDFMPNAVHSGIYAARDEGYYRAEGIDLTIRQPGESTDAPKLLAAGRADFAILDIHDLGIARERGVDVVGAMPIVQRPLAAVIARGEGSVRASPRPRRPHGRRHRPALRRSRGRLRGGGGRRRPGPGRPGDDWLQRGLLPRRRQGRRGDRLLEHRGSGLAPAGRARPNLQSRPLRRPALPRADPDGVRAARSSANPSWSTRWSRPRPAATSSPPTTPRRRSTTLLATVPSLDRADQAAQLRVLGPDLHPAPFDPAVLHAWAAWDLRHGLLGAAPGRRPGLLRPGQQLDLPAAAAREPCGSVGLRGRFQPRWLPAWYRRRRASSSRGPGPPSRRGLQGSRCPGRRL